MLLGHRQAQLSARFGQQPRRLPARRVLCPAAPGSKTALSTGQTSTPAPTPTLSAQEGSTPATRPDASEDDRWSGVRDLLKEKEYDLEGVVDSALDQIKKTQPQCDPKEVLSNVVALSLIFTPADVRYLMRQDFRVLTADLLAWSGLLHSLHISASFLLNGPPHVFVTTTAAACMPTIQHLLHHNPDQKALGQKIKRYPALLTLTKAQLDATEQALSHLDIKQAPMRLLLSAHPVIYLRHSTGGAAYVKELTQACTLLREHGLEPNEILPVVSGMMARAHPGRSIREKLEGLKKLGLEVSDVARIVSGAPGVLLLSCADLQRKWSYLRVVLKGSKEQLLEYPQFLLLPFSRDIAPAYAYLVQHNQQHRVRGTANGKISLELLAREASILRAQHNFQDFLSQWKCDMRR